MSLLTATLSSFRGLRPGSRLSRAGRGRRAGDAQQRPRGELGRAAAGDDHDRRGYEQELPFPQRSCSSVCSHCRRTSCSKSARCVSSWPKISLRASTTAFFSNSSTGGAKPDRAVAAINVPPGTSKSTAIVLRSEALCDALQKPVARKAAGDQRDLARFELKTTIRDRQGGDVFGATDRPADIPRLLLTYDRPNAFPGDADWSQIRRDAQHSGRSPWKLYDPDGPTRRPSSPLFRSISPAARAKSAATYANRRCCMAAPSSQVLDAEHGRLSAHRVRPLRPDAQRCDAERDAEVPRRGKRAPVRRHGKQDSRFRRSLTRRQPDGDLRPGGRDSTGGSDERPRRFPLCRRARQRSRLFAGRNGVVALPRPGRTM